jgi:hypothetical protein
MRDSNRGAAHVAEQHRRENLLFRIASLALTQLVASIWDTTMEICDEHQIPPLCGGDPPKKEGTP